MEAVKKPVQLDERLAGILSMLFAVACLMFVSTSLYAPAGNQHTLSRIPDFAPVTESYAAGDITGDINGDLRVNVFDLGILAANYGKTVESNSPTELKRSDVNNNGQVDVFDLGILIGNYGNEATPTPTGTQPTITPTRTPSITLAPTPGDARSTARNLKVAFLGDQSICSSSTPTNTNCASGKTFNLIVQEQADLVVHLGDFDYADNPTAWAALIDATIQKKDAQGNYTTFIPYVAVVGNHDDTKWASGYKPDLDRRIAEIEKRMPGLIKCSGEVGVKGECKFNGLKLVLMGNGVIGGGTDHANYMDTQLAADNSLWSVCAWHVNQRDMQAGGKGDEAGWPAYQTCQKHGALIATGHEHSYSRTMTLSNVGNRTANHGATGQPAEVTLDEGNTVVMVNGLAGASARAIDCSLKTNPWWSTIYGTNFYLKNRVVINETTSSCGGSVPNLSHGVAFVEFNVDTNGDGTYEPDKARAYFKNINGQIIDEYIITSKL